MSILVYILRTNRNTLYTGQTADLKKRLTQHKTHRGSKYIRSFADFKLVYKEECLDRHMALKRESELKKLTKQQKERLIAGEKVDFNT